MEEAKSTEYPKSLHVGGDRTAPERIVRDEEEEKAARAEGFKMIDKERDAIAAKALADEPEAAEDAKPEGKPKKAK